METYRKQGFLRSATQAFRGVLHTWRTQGHLRFHVIVGILVMSIAWWCRVSRFEAMILVLAIAGVIGAEILNTAIEIVVDMVQPNFHPLAGMAKDVAAGAVLVAAIQSVVIGIIVFFPRLFRFFSTILV